MNQQTQNPDAKNLKFDLSYYEGVGPDAFFLWRFRTYRFQQMMPHFGDSVLDVGCGIGHETQLLRDEFNKKVAGVDANTQVHPILSERKIEYYSSLSDVDTQFDTVYLSHVIEHISPGEIYPFFSQMCDCVRPGGTVIIVSPVGKWFWDQPDHYRLYNRKAILTLFRDQGIEEIDSFYTGSHNVACNVLRPIRRWIFTHDWSLGWYYRLSSLSRRDLVVIGRKP